MAESIRDVLLWARANRFRVREIEAGGVRLVVDDMGSPEKSIDLPEPKSVHGAWAQVLGVPFVESDEDDTDPAEGQA